jgi:hypothetical protein
MKKSFADKTYDLYPLIFVDYFCARQILLNNIFQVNGF